MKIGIDTMRERFTAVVTELLDTDERLAVVLADIGVGAFDQAGATRRHPDRVVNVGIREQAMIGVGAGLALEGFRPIMHSYAPFIVERPWEQVKLDFLHQGVGGIFVSVGASHDWAEGGRTHQSPADVALVSTLADWEVAVPGHADEVEEILRRVIPQSHNVYLRLSASQNRNPVSSQGLTVVRQGTSQPPVVLAVGPMLDPVLDAVTDLNVTVAYTAIAKPWDGEALRRVVTGTDVILVEPYMEGTSTRAIAASLADRPTRIMAIGVGEAELRKYGTAADHDRAHGLDTTGIRRQLDFFLGAGAPRDHIHALV